MQTAEKTETYRFAGHSLGLFAMATIILATTLPAFYPGQRANFYLASFVSGQIYLFGLMVSIRGFSRTPAWVLGPVLTLNAAPFAFCTLILLLS